MEPTVRRERQDNSFLQYMFLREKEKSLSLYPTDHIRAMEYEIIHLGPIPLSLSYPEVCRNYRL